MISNVESKTEIIDNHKERDYMIQEGPIRITGFYFQYFIDNSNNFVVRKNSKIASSNYGNFEA